MGQTIHPFGKKIISVSGEFAGRPITLETNRLAFQASASVTVRCGDTVVQGIVMVADEPAPGVDFFPLTIEYEERFYAAGKISGSRYIKREGKPSEDAILAGRLIDRPIRPLFPKGYHNEAQAAALVLSLDSEVRPDIIAMIAVSAALRLTGAPFDGPIGGVRVASIDGKLVAYPNTSDLERSTLDLVVAGTKDAIMMVEAGAQEISEAEMVEALKVAHEAYQPVIQLQEELAKKVGVEAKEYELQLPDPQIFEAIETFVGDRVRTLTGNQEERHQKIHALKTEVVEHFQTEVGDGEFDKDAYKEAFEQLVKKEVRRAILDDGVRPDGRKPEEIRTLSSEVGVLPRAHGSAIFTRGSTQALNVTTLAPLSYSQMLDTMEGSGEKRYMHHYNMPGYASGEIKRIGSPGRREIGHSALAERAVAAVIPDEETFPYAIRTVTEIMSSNGSTSMAATCSSVLSLMHAGVPLKSPVSGIAMGLVTDGDKKVVILSDIQGAEDFAGDMDFKVAGTTNGITALQMDIKVKGISLDIMEKALEQAKKGRAHILEHMLEVIPEPSKELSPYAPRIETITINPEKTRDVIGKGGETINKIIEETGAEIDIRDGGIVMVAAANKAAIDKAIKWIQDLTATPEVGKVYENARVVSVLDFGAFVEFMPGHEGLVHVSEMKEERVEKPSDVVSEGDVVNVKLVAIDDRGRYNLSMRGVKQSK